MKQRVIALVDMDCFYCQVEQRLDPKLKGKPVAVVQYKTWRGGGIIAVNYEARKFGVTRNMRGDEAKAKCPDIALVRVPENRDKADISKYRDAGREVIDVLCQFSSCVERASIDEAYLDLTDAVEQRMQSNPKLPPVEKLPFTFVVGYEPNLKGDDEEKDRVLGVSTWLSSIDSNEDGAENLRLAHGALLVEEMRAAVLAQTGFTCSAGVAHNKPLSKLVCGLHKPARQTILPCDQVPRLYSTLPVNKVRSLGGKLGENLMQTLGITLMAELEHFSEAELCQKFDHKTGSWLFNIARGIDNDPVNARLIPKSIGCCKRFPGKTSLGTQQEVEHWLLELAKEVAERLEKDLVENRRKARSIIVQWSLDIGGHAFSKTGVLSTYAAEGIAAEAIHLISKASNAPVGSSIWKPPLQFLGINVSKFTEEENKNLSIQKFFKPMSKSDLPSTSNAESEPTSSKCSKVNTSSTKKEDKECVSSKTSNLKSFFLNYTKKSENVLIDNSEDSNDSNQEFTIEESKERLNKRLSSDLYDADTYVDIDSGDTVEMSTPGSEEIKGGPENNENTDENEEEAPCPQCGQLIRIYDMSDHLDHHVAADLHRELNGLPAVAPQSKVSAGNAQPAKKRKYNKSTNKSANQMKTKTIDSFFS